MKTCKTCAAFGAYPQINDYDQKFYGLCHKHPPVFVNDSAGSLEERMPVMVEDDWCLDYVPITDEQSVLDRVVAEIIKTRNKLCNRPEPLTENEHEYLAALLWCMDVIEEERNRDQS